MELWRQGRGIRLAVCRYAGSQEGDAAHLPEAAVIEQPKRGRKPNPKRFAKTAREEPHYTTAPAVITAPAGPCCTFAICSRCILAYNPSLTINCSCVPSSTTCPR